MIRRGKIMVDAEKAREAMDALAHVTDAVPASYITHGMTPDDVDAVLESMSTAMRLLRDAGMPQPKREGAAT